MTLERLPYDLTVCKVASPAVIDWNTDVYFVGRTEDELSLVCRTEETPPETCAREDGWKAFRVRGTLDFSLTGVLSKLSGILAENGIGLFAVSTYNTDYILVKSGDFDRAMAALAEQGYEVL